MFDCPKGLSVAEFRQHPLRELVADAAQHGRRGLPSNEDLDALKVNHELRDSVKKACQAVAEVWETGEQRTAWEVGDEKAARLIERLPKAQRSPSYYEPADPHADVTDPRELAALIPKSVALQVPASRAGGSNAA